MKPAVNEIGVQLVVGTDVLELGSVAKRFRQDGIGVKVVQDEYVLVSLAGLDGKPPSEVSGDFLSEFESAGENQV